MKVKFFAVSFVTILVVLFFVYQVNQDAWEFFQNTSKHFSAQAKNFLWLVAMVCWLPLLATSIAMTLTVVSFIVKEYRDTFYPVQLFLPFKGD